MDWEIMGGVLNIIIINLVLSGDNAVVIALASRGLSEEYRKKAIFWGATLAVVLRILLTFVAAMLLKVPLVQMVGGLLLAWIAIKLLYPEKEHCETEQSCSSDFKKALLTIIWADLIMSLDNVLAVAGASGGNLYLLVFGLALSIPIVLAGSTLLSTLMRRFPWLVYAGAGVLAWTAGKMLTEDKFVEAYVHAVPYGAIAVPLAVTVLVVFAGWRVRCSKQPAGEES